ncbi:MAG: tyrosine-type recombinase/integrase [Planctomycetaceae bacterium]|nr:tyrosine-type recombinase/integrase [Planctomycetaceae bacterium]
MNTSQLGLHANDAKIPHIVLAAKDDKNRRGSMLPLHPELVKELRKWLKQRGKISAQEKLFFVPNALHRILDHDLKFAGIAKRDSLNRVIDVHALRHTHATLLAQSGVSPSIAKSAMRHSDIRLTMNVYSHLELGDVAEGVNHCQIFSVRINNNTKPAAWRAFFVSASVRPCRRLSEPHTIGVAVK